jgi:hypothetical protein
MSNNVPPPTSSTFAPGHAFARRARAAYWSRFWLFLSAAVSWVSFVMGPDVEGLIAGVLLTGMTVIEFRVRAFFLAGDERGPVYGWWNQCLFAALFAIYGWYHGTYVTITPSLQHAIDAVIPLYGLEEGDVAPMLSSYVSLCYYSIGVVGAVCQFWLACYYRMARKSNAA